MSTQRKQAPGELELVRAFVNTLDVEQGADRIATPAGLEAWLREAGLASPVSLDAAGVIRAGDVREAVRELLLANNEGSVPPVAAVATLDAAAGRVGLHLSVAADGRVTLASEASGVDGALGKLLVIAYRAMETGTWSRLKACRNDTCLWAFYDHSRNHSGHWCSMSVCGNRMKVQAYRARHASG